jgi:ABC-type polysaccharide/polyol phosphate transport system ATPase subunit
MENFAVKLSSISKKYILHHEKPTLVESFFKKKEEFWALKNINIKIKKGERIGIIGSNGAGKSTLLKIITGITSPTYGQVCTNGKIASLIDLNAGFHPDLTGGENIYINGLLLGMSKKEIKRKFNKIVDFSGIHKFIDTPFRTYSNGMALRLGFAIAVYSEPDILLIDEVISVGDNDFQKKCRKKFSEFFSSGKTLIVVSHSMNLISRITNKCIWMEKGSIKDIGNSEQIIKHYKSKD